MTNRIPFPHPGEFLRDELIAELALTQTALAKATGIPLARINQIVQGKRSITAETDLRLCRYFGFSEGYFMRWQAQYDLRKAKAAFGKRIAREVRPRKPVPVMV